MVSSRVCASEPKSRMCEFVTWSNSRVCAGARLPLLAKIACAKFAIWPIHVRARVKFLQLLGGPWPDGPNVQYSLGWLQLIWMFCCFFTKQRIGEWFVYVITKMFNAFYIEVKILVIAWSWTLGHVEQRSQNSAVKPCPNNQNTNPSLSYTWWWSMN